MSGFRSKRVRNALIVVGVALVLALYIVAIAGTQGMGPLQNNSTFNTTFVEPFYYPISINYTGSWNLVYWGQNGTYGTHETTISVGGYAVLYDFKRSLNGSGNWQATMTTYAVGYEQETLCAQATKLDSQDLTLTLAIGGPPYNAHVIGGLPTINSTTASDPSAEVCYTIAV